MPRKSRRSARALPVARQFVKPHACEVRQPLVVTPRCRYDVCRVNAHALSSDGRRVRLQQGHATEFQPLVATTYGG